MLTTTLTGTKCFEKETSDPRRLLMKIAQCEEHRQTSANGSVPFGPSSNNRSRQREEPSEIKLYKRCILSFFGERSDDRKAPRTGRQLQRMLEPNVVFRKNILNSAGTKRFFFFSLSFNSLFFLPLLLSSYCTCFTISFRRKRSKLKNLCQESYKFCTRIAAPPVSKCISSKDFVVFIFQLTFVDNEMRSEFLFHSWNARCD